MGLTELSRIVLTAIDFFSSDLVSIGFWNEPAGLDSLVPRKVPSNSRDRRSVSGKQSEGNLTAIIDIIVEDILAQFTSSMLSGSASPERYYLIA